MSKPKRQVTRRKEAADILALIDDVEVSLGGVREDYEVDGDCGASLVVLATAVENLQDAYDKGGWDDESGGAHE